MLAALTVDRARCSVQRVRQQLFVACSDAAFRAHLPDLFRAARSVHVLSHGHLRSVSMSMKYRVCFHCELYKVDNKAKIPSELLAGAFHGGAPIHACDMLPLPRGDSHCGCFVLWVRHRRIGCIS